MQLFYYDTSCKRVRFLRQILSSDAEVAFLITGSYDSFAISSYFPIMYVHIYHSSILHQLILFHLIPAFLRSLLA